MGECKVLISEGEICMDPVKVAGVMAHPNYEEGGAILFRVCKILSLIYQRLLAAHETSFQTHEEGSEVELGRGRTVGILQN
jgi:hypothetical protein